MQVDLVKKYSAPVPRYTSYPTSPHFSDDIGVEAYAGWLSQLPERPCLSLYVHIPFCGQICWYCGCHAKAVQRYEPVADYLDTLKSEIGNVVAHLPSQRCVQHIHWGGGSPNILKPDDIERLAAALKSPFRIREDAEFAVEVDPRGLDDEKISAFARAGVDRVSIGVQDFDDKVQHAINRVQPFEMTKAAIDKFRSAGVPSINIDLVYGLPYQTRAGVAATVEKVLALRPDRIALFGYAHLPERIAHQRLIPREALPQSEQRFALANRISSRLVAAGYRRIGLDHFARPEDSLARAERTGSLRRNFQGYTTDKANALIGLGATAIGQLPQGFVGNAVDISGYRRAIAEKGLATARGYALTEDDHMRALAIEQLMCNLRFPATELKELYGKTANHLLAEARDFLAIEGDGLVEADGDGFVVTERGRPFLRTICACFDAHLGTGAAQHSAGV